MHSSHDLWIKQWGKVEEVILEPWRRVDQKSGPSEFDWRVWSGGQPPGKLLISVSGGAAGIRKVMHHSLTAPSQKRFQVQQEIPLTWWDGLPVMYKLPEAKVSSRRKLQQSLYGKRWDSSQPAEVDAYTALPGGRGLDLKTFPGHSASLKPTVQRHYSQNQAYSEYKRHKWPKAGRRWTLLKLGITIWGSIIPFSLLLCMVEHFYYSFLFCFVLALEE